MQPLHFIAHMLKKQFVLVQVHLQPSPQQSQQELHTKSWNHTLVTEHSHHLAVTFRLGFCFHTKKHGVILKRWKLGTDGKEVFCLSGGWLRALALRGAGDKS